MSNAKRFLSVILAMILVCSTLVVGANAAYTAYKDGAIAGQYNALDKPVLTTAQYASAAMDEVDRMLSVEQIKLTRADIVVGELDVTSVDNTMDSVYALVNGRLFQSFSGMLGDLKNLNVNCFASVRRTTAGKTDIDVIYAVLQFLYDNKGLVKSFLDGTIDLGSIVASLVDISEFQDVNKLLKEMLWKEVYSTPVPSDIKNRKVDDMAQTLVTNLVSKEVPAFVTPEKDYTIFDGDGRNAYQFIDDALKVFYNGYGIDALNSVKFHDTVKKMCGVEITTDAEGKSVYNYDNVNAFYGNIINCDFTLPKHTFSSGIAADDLNNCVADIVNAILAPGFGFTWQNGSNDTLITNAVNLAKAIITYDNENDLGLFASYIHRASDAEVAAMSNEQLIAYILRAIINGSADGMYIPDSADSFCEFGYYALTQLLATSVPALDFSSLDPNSTETLLIMGIDFAIYSINASLDMDLDYVMDMNGVDAQLKKAAQYGIKNYGGLLNGIALNESATGWETIDTIIFSIIPANWLPQVVSSKPTGQKFKTLLLDVLIGNIINLDFGTLAGMLADHNDSELHNYSMKKVILNEVVRIVNIIFPGAMSTSANNFDDLITNAALANTVDKIFSDLWNYKSQLVASILPTLCDILDLTSAQKFKFPTITYDELYYSQSRTIDTDISIRNSCTGINTGYTDKNGVFHQDSLYTYQIVGVTTSISTVKIMSKPDTLSGGQTGIVKLGGSFTGETPLAITIKYNVLTEDGSSLTTAPIEENIYMYLSGTSKGDAETKFTASSGSFAITDGPKYIYANSIGDIFDIQWTLENASSTKVDLKGMGNAFTVTNKKLPADYFQYKTGQQLVPAVDASNKGIGKGTWLEQTDAYKELDKDAKEDVWQQIITTGMTIVGGVIRTYSNYTFTAGITAGTANLSGTIKVFPYNDYNLGSILTSEMNKHRQPSNYSDASKWTAYVDAMKQAASAVYSPFVNGSFANATTGKARLYESASIALEAAIEELDACSMGGGFDDVFAIINQYNPDNEGKEYDDPSYNYFGVADYAAYTYYNYRTEYRRAMSAYNSTQEPDEEGNVKVVDALSVAEYAHRLGIMGSRLLPVKAEKKHLVKQLANCMPLTEEDKYTAESWADYMRAYNFATSVNGDTSATLKQSKVDTAYENLLEYEKRLIPVGSDPGPADEPEWTPVDPESGVELDIIEGTEGQAILVGLEGAGAIEDIADFFDTTNCTVEIAKNEQGKYATGSVITVKDNTGAVIATYVASITGDINGDGMDGDLFDLNVAVAHAGTLSLVENEYLLAGDVTGDDAIDLFDVNLLFECSGNMKVVDYVNRTIV